MAIYLTLPYATGSVTADIFVGTIAIDGYSFGVSRSVSMVAGSLNSRGSAVPHFSEFTISKSLEESSPLILNQLVSGLVGDIVEVVIVEGEDKAKEIVRYILRDSLVCAYNVSGSGGRPQETVSFTYSVIEVAVTPSDKHKKGAGAVRFQHDLRPPG